MKQDFFVLEICLLPFYSPAPIFQKAVSAVVVRCYGTAYLPVLFTMNKLINHTAFMETRHFVFLFLFLVLLLLDLINIRLVSEQCS